MTVETKHQAGFNPMEQFILLAKGAKGMAAAELVKQALEAPGLYVFSELMDIPNINEVNCHHIKCFVSILLLL
jgi:COP9 signalosome complex subunit 7